MRTIFLIMIGLSSLSQAEFSRDNGVVTDSYTQLEWQDDYVDNGGDIKNATWRDAIDYCESLSLNGQGWRVPNINELSSLIDYSTTYPFLYRVFKNPSNDNRPGSFFSSDFWTSTTNANNTDDAWIVRTWSPSAAGYNLSGGQLFETKNNTNDIRCVRDKQ